MADRDGARGVLAAALPAVADALAAQAEMPVQETLFDAAAMPALRINGGSTKLTPAQISADTEARRKGGRPPGAQNIATRQIREYLLARGMVPQKWMMDWMMVAPEELAARLGCSIEAAFQHQKDLSRELGRYIMAPMASVDDKGNVAPSMTMVFGTQVYRPGDDVSAARKPWDDEPLDITTELEAANER